MSASVNINTDVFEKIAGIMKNFSKSINDIQRHIDGYLESAKLEFNRHMEAIASLTKKAKEKEKKAEANETNAKKTWEKAEQEVQQAIAAKNTALSEMLDAKQEKNEAKTKMDEAYEDKQEAWYAKKNHDISYDEFLEYLEDWKEKKKIYFEKKEDYNNTINQLNKRKRELGIALQHQKEAKRDYWEAQKQHTLAIKERKLRESNLKDAQKNLVTFKMYCKDYYRNYFPGEAMSCNTLLTLLRTSMKREFSEKMKKVEQAANNILRCSLIEGVSVDNRYIPRPTYTPKTKEVRTKIIEKIDENIKELNEDMRRPEDEQPKYIERCKYCHLPLRVCICPPPNDPEKIN